MITLFYRNQTLLILTIAVILIAGLSALLTLPRMEDPRLSNRSAVIITEFPGATAERVETLVTDPLEEVIRETPEVLRTTSSSSANVSSVTVELKDYVTDTAEIWSKVRNKINDAKADLPPGAGEPDFDEFRGAVAYSLILGLAWEGGSSPPEFVMTRLAEELADRLRRVSGTEQVELFGEADQEILVEADPLELADLGISPGALSAAIDAADTKLPSGSVSGAHAQIPAEIDGELDSLARIRAIPLRAGQSGEILPLGAIADVRKQKADPPASLALVNGRPGILIAARITDGLQIDRWAADARPIVRQFRSELPPTIPLDTIFDQSIYTMERLLSLSGNLMLGALIVISLVFLTMGWRSALLVGSALPISVSLTLFAMRLLNIPLHQMSITGLIIALGLLIDNAIVMVDETRHSMAKGLNPSEAVTAAVRHLFAPLLGSTLTTVLAFLPIVLLTGNVGEFVGMIGGAVVLAILSSFIAAMTITPALTAIFGGNVSSPRWYDIGVTIPALHRGFTGFLALVLRRPLLGITAALTPAILGFALYPQLESQFFPDSDRNQFHIQIFKGADSSIQKTEQTVLKMDKLLRADDRIDRVDWSIGRSAPPFYYNVIMRHDRAPDYAQALIHTARDADVNTVIRNWQAELDWEFPGVQTIIKPLGQGPPIEAPVEVRLTGSNLTELREAGRKIRALMTAMPEVVQTRTTLRRDLPKLNFTPRDDELLYAGLTLSDVARQTHGATTGYLGGSVLEGTEEMPIRVRFGDRLRSDVNGAMDMTLVSHATADWIPMSALGPARLTPDFRTIPRRARERILEVKGYIAPGELAEEVNGRFMKILEDAGVELPASVRMSAGGEAEEKGDAVAKLLTYAPVLGVLMAAILVLSFQSFALAGVLGIVAAIAFGTGLLVTWFSGFPYGFMGMIGTAGLIGVAINDSIVVLASINSNQAARAGDPQAIAEAVMVPARHIVTTTLTTIGGFMPLILAGGMFWPPLAIVIAGGVAGATFTALIFIPAAYRLIKQ